MCLCAKTMASKKFITLGFLFILMFLFAQKWHPDLGLPNLTTQR
ncbi:hypothetical protein RGQ29_029662 [Quercus rubra]|uniref:Uncharacterized protein n=1 Tax=Quercus rubra TaxID=3512 RepID=A0AAN7EG99_QUERU|nr:hypothetical protein RGQ29_029662 [Quercus rubra]